MKRLGLLRHAKSDWDDMALRDFDRGLNARGRKGAALMGAHIAQQGENWGMVLASPAARVRRTLEASGLSMPVQFADQAYLADSSALLALIGALDDSETAVLLAGHNPGLQDLALDLARGNADDPLLREIAVKFPTAAYAVFELDIDHWSECREGCGRLVHFARPRDIDPALGPEPGGH